MLKSFVPEPLLLACVGGSPAVITETLYGLYQSYKEDADAFKAHYPKHLRVITTTFGFEQIKRAGLLEKNGVLEQFSLDYNLPKLSVSEEDIWIVRDSDGNRLEDFNTEQEHAALADFIVAKVRELTSATQTVKFKPSINELSELLNISSFDEEALENHVEKVYEAMPGCTALIKAKTGEFSAVFDKYNIHTSVAGGRKSMSFMLGYALSMFGRAQDKVSHVLVSPSKYESCPDFYYPKPAVTIAKSRSGEDLDLSQARVMLADIPIVKMAMNMPQDIYKENLSYSETVENFKLTASQRTITLYPNQYQETGEDLIKKAYRVNFSGKDIWIPERYFATLWGWCEHYEPVALAERSKATRAQLETVIPLALKIVECYLRCLDMLPANHHFSSLIEATKFIINSANEQNNAKRNIDWEFLFGKDKYSFENSAKLDNRFQSIEQNKFENGLLGLRLQQTRNKLDEHLTKELGRFFTRLHIPLQKKPLLSGKGKQSALCAFTIAKSDIYIDFSE